MPTKLQGVPVPKRAWYTPLGRAFRRSGMAGTAAAPPVSCATVAASSDADRQATENLRPHPPHPW
eukprot:8984131-Pyramimonas_sp.AAC.1